MTGLLKGVMFWGTVVLVVGILMLLLIASRSEPLPSTATALTTVNSFERVALEQVCAAAAIDPTSLRLLASSEAGLFDHEVNRRAVTIRDGHITGLSIQGLVFAITPDFSHLSSLESLDLRNSGLSDWPKLTGLASLRHINLSGNPLSEPAESMLPEGLRTLILADTNVYDLQTLSSLLQLTHLDLSGTKVRGFDPLLPLALESLNLSRTPLAALPANLPVAGEWALNLDNTVVTKPLGYSEKWPFDGWVDASPRNADTSRGDVGRSRVKVEGSLAPLNKPLSIALPRTSDGNAPPVTLRVSVLDGRARIWLLEPPTLFASPWFKAGKVQGFGSLRRRGYVFAEVSPGKTVSLQGTMESTSTDRFYERAPENRRQNLPRSIWVHYSFFVEPLDGQSVTGLAYRVEGPI